MIGLSKGSNIRFISFFKDSTGKRTGFVYENKVYDITTIIGEDLSTIIKDSRINETSFLSYLKNSINDFDILEIDFENLINNDRDKSTFLLIPYHPPEVWGVGVTYKKNRDIHEDDLKARESKYEGLYSYVYSSVRPEIFFKALPHHCVGTHEYFTIREDSKCTIVEAELACIYNSLGNIIAYTAVNDITAWDIELECPLFLNYAKIFDGGCVIGPSVIPAVELDNPLELSVTCIMMRNGQVVFNQKGNTSNLKRSLNELSNYLTTNRKISDGTILCTGTAVGIPSDMNCQSGDVVQIEIEKIGKIINTAKQ